jgi:hypothetical protein
MTVTPLSDEYHFQVTTTDHDPYISTSKLTKPNPADSNVLCFEYKSTTSLDFLQLFFAEPITEARSIKTGPVPPSTEWKEHAIPLKHPITSLTWGTTGQYLRIDFGNDAGYHIELRNIHFRGMNEEEQKAEDQETEKRQKDLQFAENLQQYLKTNYPAHLSEVDAGATTITITGTHQGSGRLYLCEIPPHLDLTQLTTFEYRTPLPTPHFTQTFERYATHQGITRDRTLSKWVIVNEANQIQSHARYPDKIHATQTTFKELPATKKGLGGYFNHSLQYQDLTDLGITSVTVNLPITACMYSTPAGDRIPHPYGGKTWYFDRTQIEAMDNTLKACHDKHIIVAAILLLQKATESADPTIGHLLQHPHYSGGYYTMPNMTTPESVNTYAAALDFLASRYTRPDKTYGRIHHWIMHNEVDAGYEWTNMGTNRPMIVYTDTYLKSMRLCYHIVRQYDPHAEVFASFTHSWATPVGDANHYSTLEMLNTINDYCTAEGDFPWALAYHCYPQDLNEPKTWNDTDAIYSPQTKRITFKNLEVLDHWAKQPRNQYQSNTKRTVWLSENGLNSRTYSEQDLLEQAAGFAWGWTKLKALDGIDAMQWHNWYDNPGEFGLRIGLRKYPSDNLTPKDVWYAYQAAGTDREETFFRKYLPIIGLSDWNILQPIPNPQTYTP